jgi:hypothetical protein
MNSPNTPEELREAFWLSTFTWKMADAESQRIWQKIKRFNEHYAISPVELNFILSYALRLPWGATMLELGVCHGRTLAALGLVAQSIGGRAFGIDAFWLEGTAAEVRQNIADIGLWPTDCYLIESDTRTAEWNEGIDLLIVDAGHDEANVKPDIEKYVPWLKHGGYVFFDDYEDPYNPDSPHWAVRYFADKMCGQWRDLGLVDGMKGWQRNR